MTDKKNRYIPDDIKGIVWRRDNGRCVVCGSTKDIEYDHIIPINKGGSNTVENIQILCKKHNRQKRDFIDAGFVVSKNLDNYIKSDLEDKYGELGKNIKISKEEYEEIILEKIEKLEEKIFPNEEKIAELEQNIYGSLSGRKIKDKKGSLRNLKEDK